MRGEVKSSRHEPWQMVTYRIVIVIVIVIITVSKLPMLSRRDDAFS